jgi:hypothetical protein
MKLYLIKMPPFGWNSDEFFTINKCYDVDPTPTQYDPQTLQPSLPSYIVRCDDGYIRKVDIEYFITQEEWIEKKLKDLGI